MPSITPFDFFENAFDRAQHLIDIYDLLLNQRERAARSDWSARVAPIFGWGRNERICRVDGNGATLLIREECGWEMSHFEHEWLAELLRAGLAFAVSAFDRYIHDLVMERFIRGVQRPIEDMPKALRTYSLPLSVTEECIRSALEPRHSGQVTRPRTILKPRFRRALRKETFQGYDQVAQAFGLMGLNKVWSKVAKEMKTTSKEMRDCLNEIVNRRNKIVHEADTRQLERPQSINLNEIDTVAVQKDMDWLYKLAEAIDSVIYDIEENGSDD